jgi:hypothetical protein
MEKTTEVWYFSPVRNAQFPCEPRLGKVADATDLFGWTGCESLDTILMIRPQL